MKGLVQRALLGIYSRFVNLLIHDNIFNTKSSNCCNRHQTLHCRKRHASTEQDKSSSHVVRPLEVFNIECSRLRRSRVTKV